MDADTKATWRPEIQALRTIAVLLVVLFHLWPGRVPGGFVGVDAFFVISGFLITSQLLREIDRTGTVKLSQFWARRIRRLLPAAFVVLLVTLVGTILIAPRTDWAQFFGEIAASAGYIVNWVLAGNSVNYFSQGGVASPVQHYWSLSVEEQFYLIWPLLVLAVAVIWRRAEGQRRVALGVVMGVVFVVCLVVSIVGAIQSQQYFYFATPSHAWEFAAGGLLGLLESSRRRPAISTVVRDVAAWLGYALLIASGFVFTGADPFPGWIALWPVGGVLLVIWAGSSVRGWSSSRLAEWRLVRFFGDTSYSLYLWHWPPIALAAIAFTGIGEPWYVRVIILGGSIVLGYLSFRFIENPVRRAKPLVRSRTLTYGLAAVATIAVCATTLTPLNFLNQDTTSSLQQAKTFASHAIQSPSTCFGATAVEASGKLCSSPQFAEKLYPQPASAANDDAGWPSRCWAPDENAKVTTCHFGSTTSPVTIALVGDSHAEQYWPPLKQLAKTEGWSLTTYVRHSCAWRSQATAADPTSLLQSSQCEGWNTAVSADLLRAKPTIIVTSSYWHDYLGSDPESATLTAGGALLASAWKQQTDNGSKLLAIADDPRWAHPSSDCLSSKPAAQWGQCVVAASGALPSPDPQRVGVASTPGSTLLDLSRYFCQRGQCPAEIGNVVVYRDKHHLTATYSTTLLPELKAALRRLAN